MSTHPQNPAVELRELSAEEVDGAAGGVITVQDGFLVIGIKGVGGIIIGNGCIGGWLGDTAALVCGK
jgi:hypothetical protein